MKTRIVGIIAGIAMLVGMFQNCDAYHGDGSNSLSSSLGGESVTFFKDTLHPVLITSCGACHGVDRAPLHSVSDPALAHENIFASNLLNIDDPASSRLVFKVQQSGGHENIDPAVADEMLAQIEAWLLAVEESGGGVPTPTPPPVTGDASVDLFATTVHPVLLTNCASCHGVDQPPLHSVANPKEAHDLNIQTNLIDLLVPANSRLVVKVQGGHENIPVTVADELLAQITTWVQGGGGAGVEPIVLEPTFKSINALILQPKCATCHNPNGTRKSEDYSNYQTTVATGKLNGDFWDEIVNDDMPTGNGSSPLNAEEKAAIRAWLDLGYPNN